MNHCISISGRVEWLAVAAWLLAGNLAVAGDWPQFRGDAARTGDAAGEVLAFPMQRVVAGCVPGKPGENGDDQRRLLRRPRLSFNSALMVARTLTGKQSQVTDAWNWVNQGRSCATAYGRLYYCSNEGIVYCFENERN